MCWATPSSCDSSPMVLRASGDFSAVATRPYFAIRSRMIWLARKVITRRGAIGTSMPVFGLRPTRWPLSRRMKVPKPEIFTLRPSDSEWHMWCSTRSTRLADSERDRPSLRWTTSARSARVRVPLASASLFSRAIPRSAIKIFSRPVRRGPPSSIHVRNKNSTCRQFDILPDYRTFSIPERCRSPCKATTHRFKHNNVPALDSAVLHCGIERKRNRCRGSICMFVNGNDNLFGRKAELPRGSVQNAGIRLVRDDPVDLGGRKTRRFEHFVENFRKIDHGVAEHLASLHAQFADGTGGRRTAVHEQQIVVTAVRVKLCGKDPALGFLCAQNKRACAVAEQDAGGAVLPVEQPAEGLRANDEGLPGVARSEHRIRDRHRIEKAGAHRVH